ncbi:MAG: hypothetical protein OXE86_09310 [Alphaproteobacteria bacterium]|nr:hypothetical protein [Alphaproteobacteria bacterium]
MAATAQDSDGAQVWRHRGVEARVLPGDPSPPPADPTEDETLRQAIAVALAWKPGPLSGVEARFLRLELGLTQNRLAYLTATTAGMMVSWERLRSPAPAGVDLLLRVLCAQRADEPQDRFAPVLWSLAESINLAKDPPQAGDVFLCMQQQEADDSGEICWQWQWRVRTPAGTDGDAP